MRQRGRKSAAEQELKVAHTPERPEPPEDLNEFQKSIWRGVVANHRADWFRRDNYPLLHAYCVNVWHVDQLDRQIAEAFEQNETPLKLLRARDTEVRGMNALARSMRLTQQSQQEPKTAARQRSGGGRKPWDKQG